MGRAWRKAGVATFCIGGKHALPWCVGFLSSYISTIYMYLSDRLENLQSMPGLISVSRTDVLWTRAESSYLARWSPLNAANPACTRYVSVDATDLESLQ